VVKLLLSWWIANKDGPPVELYKPDKHQIPGKANSEQLGTLEMGRF
jgi:hypothetical protein